MRRAESHAATTGDEENVADGRFPSALERGGGEGHQEQYQRQPADNFSAEIERDPVIDDGGVVDSHHQKNAPPDQPAHPAENAEKEKRDQQSLRHHLR